MKIKLGLDNINHLLDRLGRPEKSFPSIHVAGTNGKGSTCAMLEAIYKAAGLKTGLFTSPHLVDVRERIRINGREISLKVIRDHLELLMPTILDHECSFFEILTATAFSHFAGEKVDIAIVETGLGGRLDATNVLVPEMSVITEIDIDHSKLLGSTPLQIAREKAGIIKETVPLVSSASKPEVIRFFELFCAEKNSRFISTFRDARISRKRPADIGSEFDLISGNNTWSGIRLNLPGEFQIQNSAAAILAFETLGQNGLPFDQQAVYNGLQKVNWRGRLHVLQYNPTVIVDVAHNYQGITHSMSQIAKLFKYDKLLCVFGVLADKNVPKMTEILNDFVDQFIAVTPNDERGLNAEQLAGQLKPFNKPVQVGQTVQQGFEHALHIAAPSDLICVIGSHFVAGEVLKSYKKT